MVVDNYDLIYNILVMAEKGSKRRETGPTSGRHNLATFEED